LTKVDFTTGLVPRSLTIGDLDGDGKVDLVVANAGSNTISVFRNNSTGAGSISYEAKVDFTTESSPYLVSIGDLDGDGKADLAVPNRSDNTISIFRNISSGAGSISFAPKVDFTTGTEPFSISIGDLDGDSKLDLAVANRVSNTVSIFRNMSSGAGSISYLTKVDLTTGPEPLSVSIGDLDGDGKPDLAVANNSSNTVSVFRNSICVSPVINNSLTNNTSCDPLLYNGSISASNGGVVTGHTFEWFVGTDTSTPFVDNTNGVISGTNGETISGLAAVNYTVRVTINATGCASTQTFVILDNSTTPVIDQTKVIISDRTSCSTINGSLAATDVLVVADPGTVIPEY